MGEETRNAVLQNGLSLKARVERYASGSSFCDIEQWTVNKKLLRWMQVAAERISSSVLSGEGVVVVYGKESYYKNATSLFIQ